MENKGIWSENIVIRAFMVDKNREANVVAIQNICQEVAGNHANFRRLGYADMQAQGLAWVLNRLKIKVFQFPKWTETVTVATWVSQMQPFSHRHFQVSDTEGMILANAYTVWIPIDVATKRPKRQLESNLPMVERLYNCEPPEKLPYTEGCVFSSEHLVQYSDLDMLGHVNNAKYTEWLLDDFYRGQKTIKPTTLEINYLGETFEHTVVQLWSKQDESGVFYSLKNKEDGKEVCRAKLS
ncbi:MAG: hypothetical protein JNL70_22960 [Saprospiraceae bacterium]|nr:hypothetical protein [Saprospiraceae bacterium]